MGGLSGPPLFPIALSTLKTLRSLLPSSIPLIGCGGISSGADALEFARAGASMVQIYTSMAVNGAGVPRRIKDEIVQELNEQKKSWKEVVQGGVESLSGTHPRSLSSLAAEAQKKAQAEAEKAKGEVIDDEVASLGITLASVDEGVALLDQDIEELKSILSQLGTSDRLQLGDAEVDQLLKDAGAGVGSDSLDAAVKEAEREAEEVIRQLTALQEEATNAGGAHDTKSTPAAKANESTTPEATAETPTAPADVQSTLSSTNKEVSAIRLV